jgi:hypothetical protein
MVRSWDRHRSYLCVYIRRFTPFLFGIWGTIMDNFSSIIPSTPRGYMDLPSATQLSVYVPAEVAVETTLKYLNMFSLLGSYDAL